MKPIAKCRFGKACLLTATWLLSAGSSAAPNTFADPAHAATTGVAGSITQSILALGLVLLVLFGVVALLKRWQLPLSANRGAMKVVQGLSLGGKERVVLLQVEERRFVIGVANAQVNLLVELNKAEVSPKANAGQGRATSGTSFAALLERITGKSGRSQS